MEKGKEVCKMLRLVRKQIAEANNINYTSTECQHQGDCPGSCPKCESEAHFIENQLSLRQKAGKAIKIIGLATGITCAFSASITSCDKDVDGDVEWPSDTLSTQDNHQSQQD